MMRHRRRSILIAENDKTLAQILRNHLEHAGFQVFVAYDGDQAAMLAAMQRFELIFATLDLPVVSGVQLYHHIREDLGLAETPVAVYGDLDSHRDLESIAYTDGYARAFETPIDPQTIVEYAQSTVTCALSAV